MDMKITVKVKIQGPVEKVWAAWTSPEDIKHWNFASDDWFCPQAEINLQPGGKFSYRMEAKDGSMGFDFEGTFTVIEENKRIKFLLEDNRTVEVNFEVSGEIVTLSETFDTEDEHSAEQQKLGWQSILDNFKKHVENN